jgi:hypothetical protein
MNELHEANRRNWEATAANWIQQTDPTGRWRRCHREPGLVLDERELHWLGDVAGKRIAVLGSGDNLVVLTAASGRRRRTGWNWSRTTFTAARIPTTRPVESATSSSGRLAITSPP